MDQCKQNIVNNSGYVLQSPKKRCDETETLEFQCYNCCFITSIDLGMKMIF